MKTSFKLFDFVGAPVELSLWFFVLFLFFPVSWVVAIFISVLIHELSHAYVADRKGWRVHGIRVDLFTGSASVDTNIHERDSIPVVAAGPLSNLALSILTFSLSALLVVFDTNVDATVYKFLLDFTVINFVMFLFNILPIYPMDGGRLVKDFLTIKMSSRLKAKRIAGSISLVSSILLLLYAISTWSVLLMFFSVLFIYVACKELDLIKD